ncbi:glucose-6-phosphate isomerase [Novosphingopyxis sp. YJ-S2-01]|uniref:glucose-6-phosphate isomerase n=1 Tax=Novosphingopyxis sp. YJ-S2-01 TaxID=2794021 RepID=UPI0018DD6B7C|nr:glucose-6-phosphate isomerase [Novosphingopyxis sp. YJ-S2-01]MBH9538046.1 glucose-6-phosphate isomerase [Novosphingopyxis sp. YJ-S2-01]
MSGEWQFLDEDESPALTDLFADDPQGRVKRLTIEEAGIRFDLSKTHLTDALVDNFVTAAEEAGLADQRQKLLSGEVVNPTEGRAAEHTAERGTGAPESVELARQFHARMRGLVEVIEAGAFGKIETLIHIGIGGSALGPKLLIDALGRNSGGIEVRVVSNVDGAAMAEAVKDIDPQTTLLAAASKTFTTAETLLNLESAMQWLREGGVDDPYGRVVALTANPDKAVEWGVDETRILPFSESVGGRYSLWSSIGFPAALGLGWAAYEEMLEGAGAMDRHFAHADWRENAPVMAAFADLYYTQARGAETRAIFAYDERLRLLPSYLQQLEMESNGKSVTADGEPVDWPTAPITWGGVGTDAQHAVFQLLHQGTVLVPVEFIASKEPGHDFDDAHHEALLANCFAQGAALMAGKQADDLARSYPGDRPSTTLLIEDVTPAILGALIAFYEHRTFVNAVLLGINPFDQFGVELGKDMARAIEEGGMDDFDASTKALMEAALGDPA